MAEQDTSTGIDARPMSLDEAARALEQVDPPTASEDPSQGQSDETSGSDDDQANEQETQSAEDAELEELAALDEQDADETDDESDSVEISDDLEIEIPTLGEKVPLKELKDGYLRRSDYDRKRGEESAATKQALAEAEAVKTEAAKAREQYVESLEKVQARLGKMVKEPDWEALKAESTEKYLVAKEQWREQQDAIAKLDAEIEKERQQEAAQLQQQQQEYTRAQVTKLVELFPELKEPGKYDEFSKKFREDALTFYGPLGLEAGDLDGLNNALLLKVIHDGLQHQRMLRIRDRNKKKVKTAPTVKQGAKKTPKVGKAKRAQDAFGKLRKTGSMHDAVAYLDATMGEDG